MFTSLLSTTASASLSAGSALILLLASLLCGAVVAGTAYLLGKASRSFLLSLVVLPVIVESVIMVVNGNLGAGLAVAGAFSLVRFRSVPGTAREIVLVFLAMAAGLATGMGYAVWALLLVATVCAVLFLLDRVSLGAGVENDRTLRITVPEDTDFTGLFDGVLHTYASRYALESVKTTNMGSLFDLTYDVSLKDPAQEKAFLDALRCLNANLPILCARKPRRDEM